jgi:hypothetical protein
LDKTQDLQVELGVANDATISTDVLVGDVSSANVTLVLNLDELGVDNSPEDF